MNAPQPVCALYAAWTAHMEGGDFPSAWRISQQVLESGAHRRSLGAPRHQQSIWDGSPVAGRRVLVRCHHGLGDTIQFIRYLPMLKAIARETIVAAPSSLAELLATVAGIDRILPLDESDPEGIYDVDLEVMELPFVFRTTVETIPARVPYLHLAQRRCWPDTRVAVGLVWKGGDWNQRRSIPFEMLRGLAGIDDICLYILQRDAERSGWAPGFGEYAVGTTTLDDAKLIQSLDLVISVDTMVAHLAGALGVPVWTLLPEPADWRWMTRREDSPWYPTMRLFRQQVPGQWEDVIERVEHTLREFASERQRRHAG